MAISVESFEDILVGPNADAFYAGAIRIGTTGIFEFASGANLVSPIPNTSGPFTGPVFVADFDQGLADQPLQTGGPLTRESVPTGAGYFHTNLSNPAFSFDDPVFTVSVKGISDDFVGLAAYDATGALITAAEIRTVATANWDTNVIRLMSKKPIDKVVILGDDTIIDDLTFDTDKPTILKGTKKADKIKGENQAELIDGKKGNDKLDGRGGDDTILGGVGRDKIKGGLGNDSISGGEGRDNLKGGEGQDSFLFGPLGFIDKLKDFAPVDDTIVLQRSTFSKFDRLGVEYVAADEFVVGSSAVDANDFLIYNFESGGLFYDIDGNGPTAAVQFAQLRPGLALSWQDFLVV
jgi:Ca2+-binding RTX toxin-like protein